LYYEAIFEELLIATTT